MQFASMLARPIVGTAWQRRTGFGASVAEVPGRDAYIAVAANAAESYNTTVLTATLLQMALGALVER